MNNQLTFKEKIVDFLYSIGLPPMVILRGLIALLVIGAVLAALSFFNFKNDTVSRSTTDTQTESIEPPKKSYQLELSVDQQIDELSYFDIQNKNYVVAYSDLQSQNEKIEELRQQTGLTAEQSLELDKLKLRNLQTLVQITLDSGSSAEPEMHVFMQYAQSLASSPNPELKDIASYSMARTTTYSLSRTPTEANARNVIDTLNSNRVCFENNKQRASVLLSILVNTKRTHSSNPVVDQCMTSLGTIFASSSDDHIKSLSEEIGEFALFAHLRLPTLEDRVRYQDRNALADLDNALRILEAHPEVKHLRWKVIFGAFEAMVSTGAFREFQTARKIFGELVVQLPDSHEKKSALLKMLNRQEIRMQRLGKPFDVTGKTVNDIEILPSRSDYTVLVLLDRSQNSYNILQELVKNHQESVENYRTAIAFSKPFTKADMAKTNSIPSWILVASDKTSNVYFDAFPVDTFPYILLIDKNQNIVAGNLSLVQVSNRIATIEKKARQTSGSTLDLQSK